ncbi:MAG: ATP-binding protein, partial [bacterium]
SYIISKRITKPLDVLQIGVNKIQMGDLDYKVNTGTKDEIGVLSDSFNAMVMAVKKSRADIDIKVGEQTKELANKTEDLESQKLAILNVLEDVEKEKRQVEILANDLVKFKLAVENTSEQVFITDVEGMIVYSNKSIENITGFKPSEALGKKAGTLWKLPMTLDYYKNMWDIIKNQKKNYIGEIQNKRKDGEIYTARLNISPVLNDKNEVIHFVAIERDISKEKEVDKAKTEFVSLASHQLRTPLSAINWYTEMLLAGDAGPINEEQKKYLNEVATGNKRMVALVDALLNVSRLDLGTFMIEPEPVNTKEMAKSVIAELQPMIKEKKIEIKEVYGENLPIFNADQKLLRMVLQNLLSNAFKYTPALGTVSLQMRVIQKGEIFGEKVLSGASFAISVGDNGIGIPERQQDKIFSKLFRADNARESETEGTGLGLYVIKSIIDKSGGDVWFKSEENKGTTFYIILPDSGMKKREGTKKLN